MKRLLRLRHDFRQGFVRFYRRLSIGGLMFLCLQATGAQAMLVSVQDDSSQNRFLGSGFSSCATSGKDSYTCGNDTVAGLLHLDLLSLKNYGKQFYFFNDFVYWINAQSQSAEYDTIALKYSETETEAKIKKDFPAQGIYMIALGSSDYSKKTIAPAKICPSGQLPIMAQLKYNDGNLIYAWSQDAICVGPQDTFSLQISSAIDNTIPRSADGTQEESKADAQGIDWMKNLGPSSIYDKATKSPRKIRLIKSGSTGSQPIAAKLKAKASAKK